MRASTPEVIELFGRAMNEGDLDGAMSLYEPEAVFVPQPGTSLAGLEAIREALSGLFAHRPSISGEIAKVLRAGDVALVANAWKLAGTQPDGQALALEGLSTDIVRRQPNGSWLILVDDPWGGAG